VFATLLTAERIARESAAGSWRNRTITGFLDERAASMPDQVAFVDVRQQITFAELKRLVDRAALGLLERGIPPGDVISFQLPNWIDWIVIHYAASRIGAISNPLIPIYREREVGFMVGLAKSKLIVVPKQFRGFDYPEMVERLRGDWPSLTDVLVVGGIPGRSSSRLPGRNDATRRSSPSSAPTPTTSR